MSTNYYNVDDIVLAPGSDWQDTYFFKWTNNQPIDITGFTVLFNLFEKSNPNTVLLTKIGSLIDPVGGAVGFLVKNNEFDETKQFSYNIEVIDTSNTKTVRVIGDFGLKSECGAC